MTILRCCIVLPLVFGIACGLLKVGHGVSGGSAMAPTIQTGDHFGYAGFGIEEIKRLDIVTYTRRPDLRRGIDEKTIFVSRVIGLPGETVELKHGTVFINGVELAETVFEKIADNDNRKAVVVPEESYFVLGDNRPNSEDSRYIGSIERKNIVGIVSNIIRKADYEQGKRW
jgi:signal peptidase I